MLTHVPLLRVARDLYNVPRGGERFQEYLRLLTGGPDDATMPLVALNPMGREHVAAALDALLALDADGIAAQVVEEAGRRLAPLNADLRVGLSLADDVAGGWTHRSLTDARYRFALAAALKRGWVSVLFWASETPTAEQVRAETLASIYRSVYATRHGEPKTLGQMMTQEGLAARFAGLPASRLSSAERERILAVIEPRRQRTETPVTFACLYGDEAAGEVGYPALGLPPAAGFMLATVEAHGRPEAPEACLSTR
jgi:hypothetical protein